MSITTNERRAIRAWDRWSRAHAAQMAERDKFYSADQRICPELWRAPETALMCVNDEWEERALRRIAARFGFTGEQLDIALYASADEYSRNFMRITYERERLSL